MTNISKYPSNLMKLKEIILSLSQESKNDSDRSIIAIAAAENYIKQSYNGRYFFELIQNIRDANKQIGTSGVIYIEIYEKELIISNSGAPFTEAGIKSITNIGISTKQSHQFIGHKGIGFKSVLEITDSPKIIT